jgi:hypothetical protein
MKTWKGMKAPTNRIAKMISLPFARQKQSAYPVQAATEMDKITLGSAIFTELRNPALTPLQSSPVHAVLQARTQASKFKLAGNAKMSPCRISGIVLSEVTIITNRGRRKNAADTPRNT